MTTSHDFNPEVSREPRGSGQFGLLAAANALLRHRWLVVGCMATAATIAVVVVLLTDRTYTSGATFMPQARRNSANLAGLAAQFGLAVPGGEPTQSPAFYGEIVQSREILQRVLDTTFVVADRDGTQRLRHLADVVVKSPQRKSPARRREEALQWLREHVTVVPAQRTGIVSLSATAQSPTLSRDILQTILSSLVRFNMETRQTIARAERQFTEGRVDAVRRELREAEDRLQFFVSHNRGYANSAELNFQHDRLEREVRMRQEVYTTLSQSFEQARIDEVRNTPTLTVIDSPSTPAKPNGRGGALKLLMGLVLGGGVGVGIALVRDRLTRGAMPSDELAEFAALRRAAIEDLRRPWRSRQRASTLSAN